MNKMMFRTAAMAVALLALGANAVSADTLYVAGPPPAAPGHPLRLGPDFRATQVGDLIAVQFNINVTTTSTVSISNKKDYQIGLGGATGNLAQAFLRFPTGIQGGTGSDSNHSKNGANTFTASMMAQVTDVFAKWCASYRRQSGRARQRPESDSACARTRASAGYR